MDRWQGGLDPLQSRQEVDALYDALAMDDIGAGVEIIRSMGDRRNTLALEPLAIILEYHDASIRNNAAIALGKIGDKAAVDPLIKALKDPSPQVKTSAAWALGEIGDAKAIEPMELMDITKDTPAMMNGVRKAINKIKTRGVVDKKLYYSEPVSRETTGDDIWRAVTQKTPGDGIRPAAQPQKVPATAPGPKTAPKVGSAVVGFGNMIPIILGFAALIVLILIIGVVAYIVLFPPVWAEQIHFKNSTGQYQMITVYRNATDTNYADVARLIEGENATLESDAFNDGGDKPLEYAARLHDDAERAGINCSIIATEIRGETPGHAIVAFYPKDSAPVYVDPWSTNVSDADFGGVDAGRIMFLRDKWVQTLPLRNSMGNAVKTTEYRNAGPVTYDRLMAFLGNDTTETAPYVDPSYTCSDFAVRLHDAAEEQGIKCGIVSINFIDKNMSGHCFNAFPTVDKGIVYVDDTGVNSTDKENGAITVDAIVYLQPGQDLGELPVNQTGGNLSYGFYQERKDKIQAFIKDVQAYLDDGNYFIANKTYYDDQLDQYNKDGAAYQNDLDQYNAAVTQYNSGGGTYSLDQLNAWKARIDNQRSKLQQTYDTLDRTRNFLAFRAQDLKSRYQALMSREEAKLYINHPIGTVKDAHEYW